MGPRDGQTPSTSGCRWRYPRIHFLRDLTRDSYRRRRLWYPGRPRVRRTQCRRTWFRRCLSPFN